MDINFIITQNPMNLNEWIIIYSNGNVLTFPHKPNENFNEYVEETYSSSKKFSDNAYFIMK